MASEAETSYLFERIIRDRDMSLFLSFMLSLSESLSPGNNIDPDQDSDATEDSTSERIILVDPFTQDMAVIEGVSSLEEFFDNLGSTTKNGQPPATKESIETIKKVEIEEGDGGECAVCLEEFEVGGVVKEMPCKHRFHGKCIEKWLGIHGSCPVCRYQMPVDEKDDGRKVDGEEGGERRRSRGGGGGNGEVWVSFSINRSRVNQNQDSSNGDSNDSLSNPRGDDDEVEN